MDRREFLITSGGAAAAAAASATAAVAVGAHDAASHAPRGLAQAGSAPAPAVHAAKTLRLAMPWADTGQGLGDSARRLGLRIAAMTCGRYRIEVASGEDALENCELHHGTAHELADRHPAFAYFAGLPGAMGLGGHDHAAWLMVGGGQMLWDELAAEAGLKPLLAGHAGDAPALWSREPIHSLSDLQGLRISAPGLGAAVVRGLGAEPISVTHADIAEAVGAGRIGAAEWGGSLASLAAGMARVAQHAIELGLNGHGTAIALHVRLEMWALLPEADREIFAAAAQQEFAACLAEARAHEAIARTTLAQSFGVRFAPTPALVSEAVRRIGEATVAHVAGHDARSERINQSYMAFKSALGGAALA